MSLRAVIFDFGGVLVRTRDQHLREAWGMRLGLPAGELARLVFMGESSRAAQLGRISDNAHWSRLQEQLDLDDLSLAQLKQDYFAHDFVDGALIAYVDRLRAAGFHTGILSNAGDNGRQLFTERFQIALHFDSITVSAEEGVMKPDPRIYHVALARAGALPGEAVFLDDFAENVDGARAVGMVAIHFRDSDLARKELAMLTGVD